MGTKVVNPARRRTLRHYRSVVSRQPMSRQQEWLEEPANRDDMGADWCDKKLRELELAAERLKAIVPGGAWYAAVWGGAATFPPQDDFCPLGTAAILYGAAARGVMKVRQLQACLNLLTRGADPLQVIRTLSCRMRLSYCSTSWGTGTFSEPLPTRPSRRLTPVLAVVEEDRLDRMSPVAAILGGGPPSCSAHAIQQIGMRKGRDVGKLSRKRAKKSRERKQKLAAIKAKFGISDE